MNRHDSECLVEHGVKCLGVDVGECVCEHVVEFVWACACVWACVGVSVRMRVLWTVA